MSRCMRSVLEWGNNSGRTCADCPQFDCAGLGYRKGSRNASSLFGLDLAHSWAATADTTHATTHVHAGALALQSRENGRGGEGGESEPEEGGDGLGLVAALAGVGGAVGDVVGGGVVLMRCY